MGAREVEAVQKSIDLRVAGSESGVYAVPYLAGSWQPESVPGLFHGQGNGPRQSKLG